MPSDVVISGAIATVGGGLFGFLRHRQRARADIEIARIGREAAEAECDRLRVRIDELVETVAMLRAEVARLTAQGSGHAKDDTANG